MSEHDGLTALEKAEWLLNEERKKVAELERELETAEASKTTLLQAIKQHSGSDHGLMGIRLLVERATAAEALLKDAEKVLEPFVTAFNNAHTKYAARYGDAVEIGFERFNTMPDSWPMDNITFSMGDFRAARSLCERIKRESKVEDKP